MINTVKKGITCKSSVQFVHFLTITIFFLIVIFLHISATSESMNAFVFFCQIIVANVSYGSPVYEATMGHVSVVLVKILMTVYGFWNLDFFRQVLPPFCVSANMNNLDSLALQYIAAFYPLCLISITFFCIELHGRNFRPVVTLSKNPSFLSEFLAALRLHQQLQKCWVISNVYTFLG